jgi:hypothetical protein
MIAASLAVVMATISVETAWVRERWRGWHGRDKNEPAKRYKARQSHDRTPCKPSRNRKTLLSQEVNRSWNCRPTVQPTGIHVH